MHVYFWLHIYTVAAVHTQWKKRVSSVLLKEIQAYLSVLYVTCNTCKWFEYFH